MLTTCSGINFGKFNLIFEVLAGPKLILSMFLISCKRLIHKNILIGAQCLYIKTIYCDL